MNTGSQCEVPSSWHYLSVPVNIIGSGKTCVGVYESLGNAYSVPTAMSGALWTGKYTPTCWQQLAGNPEFESKVGNLQDISLQLVSSTSHVPLDLPGINFFHFFWKFEKKNQSNLDFFLHFLGNQWLIKVSGKISIISDLGHSDHRIQYKCAYFI